METVLVICLAGNTCKRQISAYRMMRGLMRRMIWKIMKMRIRMMKMRMTPR